MKLTDFDKKNYAAQALQENYKVSLDVQRLTMTETKKMLQKVRGLAMEAKQTGDYGLQTNPAYMKLVFMEQALVGHYNYLASQPKTKIVVENEEVEKSQVVLAAQDMVDSVQKMIEQVSDMLVKELPALVDSIQSEIGVNESEQFNSQVTEALTSLTAALTQSKATLQSGLNTVTGQGATGFEDEVGADAAAGAEMGADLGADMTAPAEPDLGVEDDVSVEEPAAPEEEPEAPLVPGAGRAKR